LLLWIPGGRRRGSVPRPDPRGAGHLKSILDANPIWQGHYTPKPRRPMNHQHRAWESVK
jgi:hypothetical protein